MNAVGFKLAFDVFIGTAHAGAFRITALNHETFDDAVEGQSVIEALFDLLLEVGCRNRGIFLIQFNLDDAAIVHFNNNHCILLTSDARCLCYIL